MAEFKRAGLFQRLFPLKSNVDYYSQFMNKNIKNEMLWKIIDE